MSKMKSKFIIALILTFSVVAFMGTSWSAVSLPTANISGDVLTTATDLTFNLYLSRANYHDGISFAVANGPDESIINAEMVISGATRTGPLTFSNGTLEIRDPSDAFRYFTATLNNIVFEELYLGVYYMNIGLDAENPASLNITDVVLTTDALHPSRFIDELQSELGISDVLGLKLGFYISAGDITGTGTGSIFDGLLDGVSYVAPPTNQSPVADAGATTNNVTCLAVSCPINLDGSQSTDPDSSLGSNDDIVLFEWFVDTNNDGTLAPEEVIAIGEAVSVSLPLGMHEISLRVTDSQGASDVATITIVIDPTELSFIDIDTAHVKHNGLVKITGKLALPAGISYFNVNSVGHASIGISSLGNVIDEPVDFTESGNRSKWKYEANPVFGIENFKIDWSGAKFSYHDPMYDLKMKSHHIGESETSLQIKSCAAVTLDINGVTVDIDRTRTDRNKRATCSNASSRMDRDNDGEDDDRDDDHGDKDDDDHNSNCTTNVILPFALSPEMAITITHGTVTESISVADYYTAAVGKYKLMGRFDTTGIDFSALNPDLSLTVALGDQGFRGTLVIDQATWTKIRSNQWVYDPN